MTIVHKKFGLTDADWIQRSINEARVDPVGLWALFQAGREGFGLEGSQLESFIRRLIVGLVSAGAVPVVGRGKGPWPQWRPMDRYGSAATEVADAIISEWRSTQTDPDIDGVWFAFPSAIDE
jgi:hypothetical protein